MSELRVKLEKINLRVDIANELSEGRELQLKKNDTETFYKQIQRLSAIMFNLSQIILNKQIFYRKNSFKFERVFWLLRKTK